MKSLRADLDGGPNRKRGPFDKILQDYATCALDEPKINLVVSPDVIPRICPNGRLAPVLGEQSLQWHSGLASLCRPEIEGQVGAAAKLHQEHTQRLFLKWREKDDSFEYRYDSPPKPGSNRTARRGAHLCPGLPIPDREFLSEAYLTEVLRPYARAEYECRQIFWKHLRDGQTHGHWIGFRPTNEGAYVEMPPGAGFGAGGHYEIDRTTYLYGFNKAESELGLENYPHSDPYPGQDTWMFIGAEQVARATEGANNASREISQATNKMRVVQSSNSKLLHRRERGFGRADEKFILIGVELCLSDLAISMNRAAEKVVEKHSDEILGNSVDAKVSRLRKGISEALNQKDKWAENEDLSKLLQKYPNQSNAP